MSSSEPPPRPPPHGAKPSTGPLPPGNYDIFVIPPSSSGSGFLYLPSLRPTPNSFIAGFVCAAALLVLWLILLPILRQVLAAFTTGGGPFLLVIAAAGLAFLYGRSQPSSQTTSDHDPNPHDSGTAPGANSGNTSSSTNSAGQTSPKPGPSYAQYNSQCPPKARPQSQPQPQPQSPKSAADASSAWDRAREETRQREQERKAAAEKLRWEQTRAKEAAAREHEARERSARKAPTNISDPGPSKPAPSPAYQRTSTQSQHSVAAETEPTSYRPYDTPPPRPTRRPAPTASYASSVSGASESSWAPSAYTSASSPPPSHASFASSAKRGPYTTTDPDKVMLGGVHLFTTASNPHPASQLLSRQGEVTDGLILRITTEGLFIDDDVRKVPQREWDIKAWSIKLVETGKIKKSAAAGTGGLTVLRVTVRATENKRYVFVLPAEQAWKVDLGLEKLRKGPQVRAMGMSGLKESEMKGLLSNLGWCS